MRETLYVVQIYFFSPIYMFLFLYCHDIDNLNKLSGVHNIFSRVIITYCKYLWNKNIIWRSDSRMNKFYAYSLSAWKTINILLGYIEVFGTHHKWNNFIFIWKYYIQLITNKLWRIFDIRLFSVQYFDFVIITKIEFDKHHNYSKILNAKYFS